MKLNKLKPRLQTLSATKLQALPAGTVERKRGSAGVKDRNRIRERDCGLCQNCQHAGRDVDHDVPLWAGGSDDESNKRLLCDVRHDAKSKLEASQRASGRYDRNAVLRLMDELRKARRFSFG